MSILLNKHKDLPTKHGYLPTHGFDGMALRDNLAKNLERILRAKKVTQKELAAAIGLTQGSISGWINQHDWPEPENLDKVMKELAISPEELFRDPPEKLALPNPEDELFQLFKIAVKKAGFKVVKKN